MMACSSGFGKSNRDSVLSARCWFPISVSRRNCRGRSAIWRYSCARFSWYSISVCAGTTTPKPSN